MFTMKSNECKRLIKAINRQYLLNKLQQNNKHTRDSEGGWVALVS